MSMCRVVSCVVERGCFLWPGRSVGKTLLAFALLHFALQGQTCKVSRDFLLLHSSPLWWKKHLFLVLVLEGLVGPHRTVQLLWQLWLGHRLGLLWYWMICLGNEQRVTCTRRDFFSPLVILEKLPSSQRPLFLNHCPAEAPREFVFNPF